MSRLKDSIERAIERVMRTVREKVMSVLNRFEGAKAKIEILEKKLTELKCNRNLPSSQELEDIEEAIKEV